MRNRVKILVLALLLGVIWAAGLAKADTLLHSSNTSCCIEDFTQSECYEEYLHDANDNSQLHLSSRRRSSSSTQNHSLKKSHRRSLHSRTFSSATADNRVLECGACISYLENCGWQPLISHRGSTTVTRLHQFRI